MNDRSGKKSGKGVGGFVFYMTAVGTVLFFWWLLVLDHGTAALH